MFEGSFMLRDDEQRRQRLFDARGSRDSARLPFQ